MTHLGHEERFRLPSRSVRYLLGKATFAKTRGNRRDAPYADSEMSFKSGRRR